MQAEEYAINPSKIYNKILTIKERKKERKKERMTERKQERQKERKKERNEKTKKQTNTKQQQHNKYHTNPWFSSFEDSQPNYPSQ